MHGVRRHRQHERHRVAGSGLLEEANPVLQPPPVYEPGRRGGQASGQDIEDEVDGVEEHGVKGESRTALGEPGSKAECPVPGRR